VATGHQIGVNGVKSFNVGQMRRQVTKDAAMKVTERWGNVETGGTKNGSVALRGLNGGVFLVGWVGVGGGGVCGVGGGCVCVWGLSLISKKSYELLLPGKAKMTFNRR